MENWSWELGLKIRVLVNRVETMKLGLENYILEELGRVRELGLGN